MVQIGWRLHEPVFHLWETGSTHSVCVPVWEFDYIIESYPCTKLGAIKIKESCSLFILFNIM